MNRSEMIELVISVVTNYLSSIDGGSNENVNDNTRLIGQGALLDSLGLVTVIMDIEQQINDCLGISITIADDRAMAQEKSPFRSVSSLAEYTFILINEGARI